MLLPAEDRDVEHLMHWTFGTTAGSISNEALLHNAVLTPLNVDVDRINEELAARLPTTLGHQTYLSADSAIEDMQGALHGVEILNMLRPAGVPAHRLSLKVGMPIMLLRNLSGAQGLVNGTRIRVTHLMSRCIAGEILTGTHRGATVFLPRISVNTDDDRLPFQFKRHQFPVRACYAMTVNKAQGQTLQRVGLYLPHPCFAHGQLYVALSRVGNPAGIKVLVEHTEPEGDATRTPPGQRTPNVVLTDLLQQVARVLPSPAPRQRGEVHDTAPDRRHQQQQQQAAQHQPTGAATQRASARATSGEQGRPPLQPAPLAATATAQPPSETAQPTWRLTQRTAVPALQQHEATRQHQPAWPPADEEMATPQELRTFSWLLVPLFAHAMGRGDLHPHLPANEAPFAGWLAQLAPLLSHHTWGSLHVPGNEAYISASTQDTLFSVVAQQLPAVHLAIETYGGHVAAAARERLNGQGTDARDTEAAARAAAAGLDA